MSDMKCPICQQKIMCMDAQDADEHSTWYCPRCIAERAWYAFGNETLWQELIRTRKALDVAVDMLKEIDKTRSVANHKIGTPDKTLNAGIMFCWATPDQIHNALTEITALTKGGNNEK